MSDQAQRLRPHVDFAACDGDALRVRLVAHVHHADVAFGINVTQFHPLPSDLRHSAILHTRVVRQMMPARFNANRFP